MENINDNNNSEGDPTPEHDDDVTNVDPVVDETLDQGVSADQPLHEDDAAPETDEDDAAPDGEPEAGDDILAAAAELQNEDHWGDALDSEQSPQDSTFDHESAPDPADAWPTNDTFVGAPNAGDQNQTIPPPPQVAAATRLTRDPFASFGGVLSGIAHHYGWDVALTRLAFVVILLITGGTALLAYVLAWVLIPRASHWPPPATQRRSLGSFSGRDIGVGLVALGALVVLGVSSGEAAGILVPLALVGGGVWLLTQNPRNEVASQMAAPNMGAPMNAAYAGSAPTMGGTMPPRPPMPPALPTNYYAPQPAAPQPAPKRSRLRRVAIVGGIGFIGLMLLGVILVPLIVIGAIASGDTNFEFNSDPIIVAPNSIGSIPALIDEDGGEIFIDLTNVDFSELDADADPISLEVNLDAGEIKVVVPDDVAVTIDAETDFVGELEIFGSNNDGISPEYSITAEDPQLILDLEVNAGRIEVVRESDSSATTVIIDN